MKVPTPLTLAVLALLWDRGIGHSSVGGGLMLFATSLSVCLSVWL